MSSEKTTLRQKITPYLKRFFRHPVSALFWFVLISLFVQENYPLSHYPMYKGWSEETFYLYIASGDEPVAAKPIFKVSVPRIKKLFGNHMGDIAEERSQAAGEKIRPYELPEEAKVEAGMRLLKQLRDAVPEKQREEYAELLAKPLTLMRIDIHYTDGVFEKTATKVASN